MKKIWAFQETGEVRNPRVGEFYLNEFYGEMSSVQRSHFDHNTAFKILSQMEAVEASAPQPGFVGFGKIPRYSRDCIVTEKIDGTNGQIVIVEKSASPEVTGPFLWEDDFCGVMAGSRNRWVTPEKDNFGFARWVQEHAIELLELGPGRHFGEWWGRGIERGYGLKEKRFSLFNVTRWDQGMFHLYKWLPWKYRGDESPEPVYTHRPDCCDVVPVIWMGIFPPPVETILRGLIVNGSMAAPGFMNPEGIVIFHIAANFLFKKTIKDDYEGKRNEKIKQPEPPNPDKFA